MKPDGNPPRLHGKGPDSPAPATAGQRPVGSPPRNQSAAVPRLAPGLTRLLSRWQKRYCSRRALARLEAWQLQDIGVSRCHAAREAAKPFWRA